MLDLFVIVVLGMLAVGLYPAWSYNRGWNRWPATIAVALLAVFILFWYIVPIFD